MRPHWQMFLRALLFSLALFLFAIAFIALGTAFFHVYIPYLFPTIPDFMFVIAFALVFVGIAYYAWRKLDVVLKQVVENKLPDKLRQHSTADIPSGNYLFLRATGDEAAGFLSMSQFLAWLVEVLSTAASTVVGYAEKVWRWTVRRVWGRIVAVIVAIIFAFWISTRAFSGVWSYAWCNPSARIVSCGYDLVKYLAIPTLNKEPIPTYFSTLFDVWRQQVWGSFLIPMEFASVICWPIFLTVVICSLAYAALVLVTACISALSLMLFGWIGVVEALFADFAVEPVPYGPVLLMHVDWNDQPAMSIFGLNHSQTYANPSALRHLADWVLTTRNTGSAKTPFPE